jgi:hypothetical protein
MNNEYCSYRMNMELFKLQLSLIFAAHKLLLLLIQYSHFYQG